MTLLREILYIRRHSPELKDKWRVIGQDIVGEEGEIIAHFGRASIAKLTVAVHNRWLRLTNHWLMTLRMLQDRSYMAVTQQEDKES